MKDQPTNISANKTSGGTQSGAAAPIDRVAEMAERARYINYIKESVRGELNDFSDVKTKEMDIALEAIRNNVDMAIQILADTCFAIEDQVHRAVKRVGTSEGNERVDAYKKAARDSLIATARDSMKTKIRTVNAILAENGLERGSEISYGQVLEQIQVRNNENKDSTIPIKDWEVNNALGTAKMLDEEMTLIDGKMLEEKRNLETLRSEAATRGAQLNIEHVKAYVKVLEGLNLPRIINSSREIIFRFATRKRGPAISMRADDIAELMPITCRAYRDAMLYSADLMPSQQFLQLGMTGGERISPDDILEIKIGIKEMMSAIANRFKISEGEINSLFTMARTDPRRRQMTLLLAELNFINKYDSLHTMLSEVYRQLWGSQSFRKYVYTPKSPIVRNRTDRTTTIHGVDYSTFSNYKLFPNPDLIKAVVGSQLEYRRGIAAAKYKLFRDSEMLRKYREDPASLKPMQVALCRAFSNTDVDLLLALYDLKLLQTNVDDACEGTPLMAASRSLLLRTQGVDVETGTDAEEETVDQDKD